VRQPTIYSIQKDNTRVLEGEKCRTQLKSGYLQTGSAQGYELLDNPTNRNISSSAKNKLEKLSKDIITGNRAVCNMLCTLCVRYYNIYTCAIYYILYMCKILYTIHVQYIIIYYTCVKYYILYMCKILYTIHVQYTIYTSIIKYNYL